MATYSWRLGQSGQRRRKHNLNGSGTGSRQGPFPTNAMDALWRTRFYMEPTNGRRTFLRPSTISHQRKRHLARHDAVPYKNRRLSPVTNVPTAVGSSSPLENIHSTVQSDLTTTADNQAKSTRSTAKTSGSTARRGSITHTAAGACVSIQGMQAKHIWPRRHHVPRRQRNPQCPTPSGWREQCGSST